MEGIHNRLIDEICCFEPETGKAAFWWLGQLGYALKLGGRVIYIDAFLADIKSRCHPPVFAPEAVVNADIVIGTHDHIDHIDRLSWPAIAKSSPQAVFVCARAHVDKLSNKLGIDKARFVGMNDGESAIVKGIKVHAIAAAHELLERDPETGLYPHLSFFLSAGGVSVYHSGDTCVYEGMYAKIRTQGKQDAMFVPINGRDAQRLSSHCIGNMTYQEAVDLVGTFKPGLAVPGHYDMFANNMEDPEKFRAYLKVKYPEVDCWIGGYGERVDIGGK